MIFLFGFDVFRALSMLMVLYSDLSIGQMLAVFAYLWFMMGSVQEVLGVQYAWNGANMCVTQQKENIMTCPRLIEVALPIREISAESVRDKSLRHGHISTLHLWWARRPLAASRAIVFASLVPDPDNPINVVRVIRSFDPCLACAVHLIDPKTNEMKKFLVE